MNLKNRRLYMKATGIVRRIDERVIIRQSPKSRIIAGVFADFVQLSEWKSSAAGLNF